MSSQEYDQHLLRGLKPLLDDNTLLPDGETVASHAARHIEKVPTRFKERLDAIDFEPEDFDNFQPGYESKE